MVLPIKRPRCTLTARAIRTLLIELFTRCLSEKADQSLVLMPKYQTHPIDNFYPFIN